jgi:hypothetical protein
LARPGGNFTGVSVDAGIEIWGNVSLPASQNRLEPAPAACQRAQQPVKA